MAIATPTSLQIQGGAEPKVVVRARAEAVQIQGPHARGRAITPRAAHQRGHFVWLVIVLHIITEHIGPADTAD